ncbi:amidohydrolase family protein [Desulfovibrio sp. OttesenSCG-928-M14]|nr:amidohydrolase family protein [Desulfovibrio sp. OttesenSCG-928-M14]
MLYLRDAVMLDADSFTLSKGHYAVEDGPQGRVLPVPLLPEALQAGGGDRILDCKGRIVTRAFTCGHHHIYSCLSRGMPPAPRVPQSFAEVLELVWWRLDKCLDKDMTEASALASAMYLAKNGVTFCIDHHAAPFAVDGSLSVIADAFDRVGIGHLLCYEVSDRDGPDIAQKGLDEQDRYLGSGGRGHVGLHASFTVSDQTLEQAVELARKHDTGIHIHVAEAASDQAHCLATHGKTVVQRLKDAGVLDLPKSILGHCVHVSEEDRALLAASPCWIAQNAESNQNNNVGLAGYGYSENVMLGTDGMHSDMIRSAQAAYFCGIAVEGLSPAGAWKRLRNSHRHTALHGPCGDGANNLIVLDYDAPTPLQQNNALGHIFYGFDSRHVNTVISSGKVIVEDGSLTMDKEDDILTFAREQAKRLWKRLG